MSAATGSIFVDKDKCAEIASELNWFVEYFEIDMRGMIEGGFVLQSGRKLVKALELLEEFFHEANSAATHSHLRNYAERLGVGRAAQEQAAYGRRRK